MAAHNKIDITGHRFGKLVAIKPVSSGAQGVRWLLQCSCGKTHEARVGALRLGNIKSCGCKKSEKGRNNCQRTLIGRTFGIATVVDYIGDIGDGGKIHWECVCDCGVRFNARGDDLKAGNTKSCGCLKFKP